MISTSSQPASQTTPPPQAPARPTMSDEQYKELALVIYDRSGIHFPENKKYVLESRLGRRLAELNIDDFDQYIAFLTLGPYQSDEFQEMFNRITINETSFFRNEPQLAVFETRVLPRLIDARKNSKRLRIWSAACSTGEEPFTLAMMLSRTLGIRRADWQIEILGTDISERALGIANEGVYTEHTMRGVAPDVRRRYFTEERGGHRVTDEVREMVRFEKHNLRDTLAAKRFGVWDVIFCRNVMIYFDLGMKTRVLGLFADQIAPDGVLFIGHSECINGTGDRFSPVDATQGFCYELRAARGSKVGAA